MRYSVPGKRDLRIDMMRGLVMVMLITVHFEFFSLFNFIAWERLGLVTSAEGFVILSGIMLGRIHRNIHNKNDFKLSREKLLSRSIQIYKANISVVLLIIIISLVPYLDLEIIKSFKNWYTGDVYNLFPHESASWNKQIVDILMLKHSPHQIQILGLYTILLLISPVILYGMMVGRWKEILAIITLLYLYQSVYPSRPTGMQFEYAFPILSWQFLFFGSMMVGYYQTEIEPKFRKYRSIILPLCILSTLCFLFLAWNSPNAAFPEWARMGVIDSSQFGAFYNEWFSKKNLGVLRVVNNIALWVTVYWLLTVIWEPLQKFVGWLLVPIGQNSLYIFIMHVPLIYIFNLIFLYSENKPIYEADRFLFNTFLHFLIVITMWFMVKTRFMFKVVPQ